MGLDRLGSEEQAIADGTILQSCGDELAAKKVAAKRAVVRKATKKTIKKTTKKR